MLDILYEIFDELNKESIKYIHWKSNEHLEAALNGDTDLDIMVSKDDQKRFIEIIQEKGFTLYQSVGKQSYVSISDYLFLDPQSSKVLHIHLHNSFVIGRKFFKEYLIPIEDHFFSEAIYDHKYNVKIMDPTQEWIILWMRYALKTSLLKIFLKRFRISQDFLRESDWLEVRLNKGNLGKTLNNLELNMSDVLIERLSDFLDNKKNSYSTLNLIISIRKALKIHKTENFTGIKYFFVRSNMIIRFITQRACKMPVPYRRISPTGGVIIAFVGSDGAGKSTVISALEKTLKKKIDVYTEYLGSGDGKSSIFRAPLQVVKKFIKFLKSKNTNGIDKKNTSEKVPLSKVIWAITLAFEKKSKIKRIWKAKARGMIIISDRYPQSEFMGINDGPLLFSWQQSKHGIKKKIADWEMQIYKLAIVYKPDILVKLMVEPEIAIMRKPHEDLNNIKQKTEIIKKINIPAKKIVVIDANKPLERVLENVYSEVSKIL